MLLPKVSMRFVLAMAVILGSMLFSAGRVGWMPAWILFLFFVVIISVHIPLVLKYNPELLKERFRKRRDVKPFDRVFALFYTLGGLALFIVAGLDAGRFGWAPLPSGLAWLGILLMILGDVPILGALVVNRHLETHVRIQKDRGHRVVTAGPYRLVRHPMYSGLIVMFTGIVLLLGSGWAFVPWAVVVAALVVRTALEDRTLLSELPGYRQYSRRTRYRLLPGIW